MLQDTPDYIGFAARERQDDVREIGQTLHRLRRANRRTRRRWFRLPSAPWAAAFGSNRTRGSTRVRRRRNRIPHPV